MNGAERYHGRPPAPGARRLTWPGPRASVGPVTHGFAGRIPERPRLPARGAQPLPDHRAAGRLDRAGHRARAASAGDQPRRPRAGRGHRGLCAVRDVCGRGRLSGGVRRARRFGARVAGPPRGAGRHLGAHVVRHVGAGRGGRWRQAPGARPGAAPASIAAALVGGSCAGRDRGHRRRGRQGAPRGIPVGCAPACRPRWRTGGAAAPERRTVSRRDRAGVRRRHRGDRPLRAGGAAVGAAGRRQRAGDRVGGRIRGLRGAGAQHRGAGRCAGAPGSAPLPSGRGLRTRRPLHGGVRPRGGEPPAAPRA